MQKVLEWLWGKSKKERVPGTEKFLCSCLPSPEDERDFVASVEELDVLPSHVMLNGFRVKNQGRLGTCTAFSILSSFEYLNKKHKGRELDMSELFLWYNTRVSAKMGSGAFLRDVLKYCQKEGMALEHYCPYVMQNWNKEPGFGAFFSSRYFRIKRYEKLFNTKEIRASLVEGVPVVFGMKIHEDKLRMDNDSVIQWPSGRFVGGHAMLIVGYNPTGFVILNSWGSSWGDGGMAVLPYKIYNENAWEAWRFEV